MLSILLALFISNSQAQTVFSGFTPSTLGDCSLRGWNQKRIPEKNSLKLINENGSCVASFSIDPQTPKISDGWRAEIGDPIFFPPGSSISYEFKTLLPTELADAETPNLVIAQWHDNKPNTAGLQRPPLSLRLKDGKIAIILFNQKILEQFGPDYSGEVIYQEDATFENWTSWKFKIFWGLDDQATIEVWKNGLQVVNYRGEVGYPTDVTAPYFKMGIYTTEKFTKPLKVLHTDFQRTYLSGPKFFNF